MKRKINSLICRVFGHKFLKLQVDEPCARGCPVTLVPRVPQLHTEKLNNL